MFLFSFEWGVLSSIFVRNNNQRNMSVLVNKNSKVIVQGFTGTEGSFHAQQMIEYGTQVVGGVTPGKGGTLHLERPVFDSVEDAVQKTGADTSIIFVPPAFAADAIMEAADAGIKVIIAITEGIPVADMMRASACLGLSCATGAVFCAAVWRCLRWTGGRLHQLGTRAAVG